MNLAQNSFKAAGKSLSRYFKCRVPKIHHKDGQLFRRSDSIWIKRKWMKLSRKLFFDFFFFNMKISWQISFCTSLLLITEELFTKLNHIQVWLEHSKIELNLRNNLKKKNQRSIASYDKGHCIVLTKNSSLSFAYRLVFFPSLSSQLQCQ